MISLDSKLWKAMFISAGEGRNSRAALFISRMSLINGALSDRAAVMLFGSTPRP